MFSAPLSIWRGLGFATVIFLAGLQGIPKDLYEAAKVDGAGAIWIGGASVTCVDGQVRL